MAGHAGGFYLAEKTLKPPSVGAQRHTSKLGGVCCYPLRAFFQEGKNRELRVFPLSFPNEDLLEKPSARVRFAVFHPLASSARQSQSSVGNGDLLPQVQL